MEIGGFTGNGIAIIAAVLGFNMLAMLAWFVIMPLRRSHELAIKRVRTFLALVERIRGKQDARDDDEDIDRAVEALAVLTDKGEGLGPLWGRKHLTSAELGIHGMTEQWPDIAGEVDRQMRLGAAD